MNTLAIDKPGRGLSFPNWAGQLRADDSLTPSLRESYRRTLAGFLALCPRRRTGATVARRGNTWNWPAWNRLRPGCRNGRMV